VSKMSEPSNEIDGVDLYPTAVKANVDRVVLNVVLSNGRVATVSKFLFPAAGEDCYMIVPPVLPETKESIKKMCEHCLRTAVFVGKRR
jgi:hypothetical protein